MGQSDGPESEESPVSNDDEDDLIYCTDDPCGTCRYCRFGRPPTEAELPDVPLDPDLVAEIDATEESRRDP